MDTVECNGSEVGFSSVIRMPLPTASSGMWVSNTVDGV